MLVPWKPSGVFLPHQAAKQWLAEGNGIHQHWQGRAISVADDLLIPANRLALVQRPRSVVMAL